MDALPFSPILSLSLSGMERKYVCRLSFFFLVLFRQVDPSSPIILV